MTDKETATAQDSQLRDYELVLIITPELEEEAISARIDGIGRLVADGGGTISSMERWGRKKLAYPIKHFLEGNYVFVQLKMKPAASRVLESNLRISEDIMRHLLVVVA